jgi:hypothetical protein
VKNIRILFINEIACDVPQRMQVEGQSCKLFASNSHYGKPTLMMASLSGLESRLQPAELSKQQRALNTSQIAGTADAPPPECGTPNPELARMHTGKCF